MLETTPQNSLALVVGIDHYQYGDPWRLSGPVADALRRVDWLIERGMPVANIALCLSSKSWTEDKDVMAWAKKRQWPGKRSARASELAGFINEQLLLVDEAATALLVFWSGHGVVDDHSNSNYLYTEDARGGNPFCISVPNLMLALHGTNFSRLREQVLVVDSCANAFSETGEAARPGVTNITSSPIDNNIRQFQMFAASPGKLAAVSPERKTGRFSEALLRAMRAVQPDKGWPDFAEAFDRTLDDVEAELLAEQQPFIVVDWPGVRRRSGPPPASSALKDLLTLIRHQAVSPDLMHRLYMRALPDPNRALGEATIEAWLRDLQDKRPRNPNHPSPLVQFGEHLARRLKREDIAKWVNDQTRDNLNAREAMRTDFDAQEVLQRPRARVFIEVDARTQKQLHWWIHAPDPLDCSTPQTLPFDIEHKDDTARSLGLIADKAFEQTEGRYELVVSMILPDVLLPARLESTPVVFNDDGLPSVPTALNRRYPVCLHWQKRVRAPKDGGGQPTAAWRHALGALGPRIAAGGGAHVVWIDAAGAVVDPTAEVAARLLKGNGICVGLGHPAEAVGEMTPREIIGCLREGVPCFFWLAEPLKGQAGKAKKALCRLFAQQEAREAPLSIGKLLKLARNADPLSSIRIVWDEPGHLPFITGLTDPAPSTTGPST